MTKTYLYFLAPSPLDGGHVFDEIDGSLLFVVVFSIHLPSFSVDRDNVRFFMKYNLPVPPLPTTKIRKLFPPK